MFPRMTLIFSHNSTHSLFFSLQLCVRQGIIRAKDESCKSLPPSQLPTNVFSTGPQREQRPLDGSGPPFLYNYALLD